MVWKPNVTVAAIIEQDGKFLLVEELTSQGLKLNQPAGHLEANESLLEAVIRETREESAYVFEPQHLIGVYRWHANSTDTTFLRFAYSGRILAHHVGQALDQGIVRTVWMTVEELRTSASHHRSPLILQCVEDYLAGKRYPLELITHYD